MTRSIYFKIALFLFFFVCIERFCRKQTGGFKLTKAIVTHTYPFVYQSPKSIDLCVLQQSFYYIGSGVQFYTFLGEDQTTILKLFKHHHLGLSIDLLEKLFPRSWIQSLLSSREKRMKHLFESTRIAFEELPEETEVFFVHIKKEGKDLGKGKIYDKIGIAHPIDWDHTDFVLQKRVEPAYSFLHHLFQSNQIEKALQCMQKLLTMIKMCSKQGIKNKDGNLLENCGFLNDRPIILDIGSFIYRVQSNNPDPHGKAVMRAKLHLLGWVKQNYPEKLPLCKKSLFHENTSF